MAGFFAGYAQKGEYVIDERSNFMDRVYFGGGLGFSANSYGTYVSLSPIVGYMFTNRFSAGVGATYQYFKRSNSDFSDNQYGGLVFARMNLVKQFFAYGEYSFINYTVNIDGKRRTAYRLPLGIGYSQILGPRSSVNVIAAYDVIYDETAFGSPWVFTMSFSL